MGSRSDRRRRAAACGLVLLAAALAAAASPAAGKARHAPWHPGAVAAAGDSLSTGYASDDPPGAPAGDHPENSWSIGSNPAVRSLYARVLQRWPGTAGRTLLVAQDGATVAALPGQLRRVVADGGIDLVTIQIGSNDICDARQPGRITPVAVVRRSFAQALALLRRGSPRTRVLATSVADEARWNDAVLRVPALQSEIEDGTVCDPRPGPDGRQDPVVRRLIQRWEQAYDRAIASVCARYATCRYDGGALYRLAYRPVDVSRADAYHPSVAGLARMAATVWRAAFAPS